MAESGESNGSKSSPSVSVININEVDICRHRCLSFEKMDRMDSIDRLDSIDQFGTIEEF